MENELEQTIEQTAEAVAEETKAEAVAPVAEKVAPSIVAQSESPKAARSNKRVLVGKVTSNKADKTIIVAIVRQVAHPLYKKYFKRTKKFMAHDELNSCKVGDTVKVIESRPLSARKRWTLVEIIERAK